MKILIVGLVNNPQLHRLQQEGQKRNHLIDGCYPSDLIINASPNQFQPLLRKKDLPSYQLIYLWTVGKRRWEWHLTAQYLHQQYHTKIVNYKIIDPSYNYYLSPVSEYLIQTKNNLNYPQSAVIFNLQGAKEVISKFHFPLVIKVSNSRQGKGISKITSLEEIGKIIKDNPDSPSFIIREFIPNNGDIRIFTIGYQALAAMKRTPKGKDFRSNISQGGQGEKFDLTKNPQLREMAEKISRLTQTEIAGVDIMLHQKTNLPYLLEVNPGPQFTGLEKYTHTNAALAIIKYFESL